MYRKSFSDIGSTSTGILILLVQLCLLHTKFWASDTEIVYVSLITAGLIHSQNILPYTICITLLSVEIQICWNCLVIYVKIVIFHVLGTISVWINCHSLNLSCFCYRVMTHLRKVRNAVFRHVIHVLFDKTTFTKVRYGYLGVPVILTFFFYHSVCDQWVLESVIGDCRFLSISLI